MKNFKFHDYLTIGFFYPVWLFSDTVWLFFSRDVWQPWFAKWQCTFTINGKALLRLFCHSNCIHLCPHITLSS